MLKRKNNYLWKWSLSSEQSRRGVFYQKKKRKKKNFEMGSWDGLNNFHSVEIGLYACLYDLNFDLV